MVQSNEGRLTELRDEIDQGSRKRRASARSNYYAAYALVVLTIAASGIASIGSFLNWNSDLTGILALIPGLLILAATQLKFQARSHWHHKKYHRLSALVLKIRFQTPADPSDDELHALAEEYKQIHIGMEDEWQRDLSLDPRPGNRTAAA